MALAFNSQEGTYTWPGETTAPQYRGDSTWGMNAWNHKCSSATTGYREKLWRDNDCSSEIYFTCEVPKTAKGCPKGYNYMGSPDWCIHNFYKASYTCADAVCGFYNTTVVTLKSQEKEDAYI
ncbi:hypothetical protein EGW08_010874, partial [Elysia chlorotica]